MARRAHKPKPRQGAPRQVAQDSYQNVQARLGLGTDNLSSGGRYAFNPITRARQDLEAMYRGSWIAGQAIDCVAEDMTRAGIDISASLEPEQIGLLHRGFEKWRLWQALADTIKWARLYGGAVAVILVAGQKLETPLRPETVGSGQFRGLFPLDRWSVQPTYEDPIKEIGPDMGRPTFYKVLVDAPVLGGQRIHHSRVIRLDGIALPYWQRVSEQGWGMSVIERLYDRLMAFDSTTTGAAQLVHKAHLRTLKVENLRKVLAMGQPGEASLAKQFETIRAYQSSEGLTLLDSRDVFETHSYAFSGLSDVLLQFAQQLSGALQIPLVRLFGQSPAGLNSSGESDVRTYYDLIAQRQESDLRDGVERIANLLCRSELDVEPPPDMAIAFRSLWQMSAEQKATIAATLTNAIVNAEAAQIVSRATAMKELRQSAQETGLWSNISDEDIDAAEAEPPQPPEMPSPPALPEVTQGEPAPPEVEA